MTADYSKPAAATERIGVDWTDRLPSGVTVSSAAWAATPTGLTLSGDTSDSTSASTLVAGGLPGTLYTVTCTATLTDSQILPYAITLYVPV